MIKWSVGEKMVNIKGLNKADVLAALHNATKPLGLGWNHDLGRDMTVEEAQSIIKNGIDDMGFVKRGHLMFDYVKGRPIKTDISGDEFDPRLFDRDAGEEGAAQKAISKLSK